MSFGNLSQIARDFGIAGKGSSKFWKVCADQIAEEVVLPALEELAYGTAQWSGSTAASWRVGAPGRVDGPSNMREPVGEEDAHSVGDPEAVKKTMSANRAVASDLRKGLVGPQFDLVLMNEQPQTNTAIYGPFREANQAVDQPLERFVSDIESTLTEIEYSV